MDESSEDFRLICKAIDFVAGRDGHPIKGANKLNEDLDIDSLGNIELGMTVEEDFGIESPDAEIDAWETVSDVCKSVEKARANADR